MENLNRNYFLHEAWQNENFEFPIETFSGIWWFSCWMTCDILKEFIK